jgi:hypothetical protein
VDMTSYVIKQPPSGFSSMKGHLFFWLYWALNSGSHTCWAGALPLEVFHQPFFGLGIFDIGSHELFALTGFKLQSSCLLSRKDYRREPPVPGQKKIIIIKE